MDRMGMQPILPVKVSVTIGTILHLDAHGNSDVTSKQSFNPPVKLLKHTRVAENS